MTTPEIKALYLLAAKVGHRTPTGRRCNTIVALLSIKPVQDSHELRKRRRLAAQVDGLGMAMAGAAASHDGGIQSPDQAQRPGGRV